VTEEPKPVGSGRFRDHAQDSSRVLGMSFASSLARRSEGCVAHTYGGPCWGGSRASCSAEAATGNTLETHPSRQENPPPCSSFTPLLEERMSQGASTGFHRIRLSRHSGFSIPGLTHHPMQHWYSDRPFAPDPFALSWVLPQAFDYFESSAAMRVSPCRQSHRFTCTLVCI